MKSEVATMKLNLKNVKWTYIITGICVLLEASTIAMAYLFKYDPFHWLVNSNDTNVGMSPSLLDILVIMPICALPIALAGKAFKKSLNLGAAKLTVVKSNFLTLATVTAVVIALSQAWYWLISNPLNNTFDPTHCVAENTHGFGVSMNGDCFAKGGSLSYWFSLFNITFAHRGIILGLLGWFFFILIWGLILYVVILPLGRLSGTILWGLMIVFFAIFVPIFHWARAFLHWFVNLILLQPNSLLMIVADVITVAVLYQLAKIAVKNK